MTANQGKAHRQTGNIVSPNPAPPQPSARERAFEELEAIEAARDEQIIRLREARLAREQRRAGKVPSKSAKRA